MAEGSWIRIGATEAHLDARTVNSIIKEALGKKIISITQMPELRQEVGEEFLKVVTPFVPMKTGQLRESGRATDDGRLYWTAISSRGGDEGGYTYNYASNVYDRNGIRWPDGQYRKPSTPNTYPRWVTKVQPGTPEWEVFANNVANLIKRRFGADE